MKKIICLSLICTLFLTLTACSKEQADSTISPTDFTQEVTENGITVNTTYYTITLPILWKDQYRIIYSTNNDDSYSLRFIDQVSFENQGHSGHIFTLSLHPAMGETLQGFFYGAAEHYLGALHIPQKGLFTLSASFPTDVQFITQRAEIYNKMHDSFQTILNSLTPITENSVYYPVGFNTFEQRAKLTTHPQKGEEVVGKFMADVNVELTYLGIALEPLNFESFDYNYDYGFHVYITKNGGKTYYCIPFREDDGTLETVYKMLEYPKLEKIWTYEEPERKAYRNFLRGLAANTNDPDSLGYYVFHDLDNDGTQELLIDNNNVLTVYKYQGFHVNPLDSYDFQTGTNGFYYPNILKEDGTPYHQLFTRYTSGGQNHYGMLTLENNKLVHTPLWDENYSSLPDHPPITEHTKNKEFIEVSKKATMTFEFYSIKKYFLEIPSE